MNTKRILFWSGFIIVILLIVWGLIVAMNKEIPINKNPGKPGSITEQDHIIGQRDALVTITEYSDFQCPACRTYYFLLEEIFASSTVPFKLVYRHFPLSQHENALPASLASEAAGAQGRFREMYGLLFENQDVWEGSEDPNPIFIGYAKEIGLDLEKFKTDLASTTLKDKIETDLKEGFSLGINATPTFFVNGKLIVNPTSYDEFKTIIEKASETNFQ